MNLNRRQFIQTAVAVGVIAALPVIPEHRPFIDSAYAPGDIRRYGAVPGGGVDCSIAIQAAFDDVGNAFIPAGTWGVSGTVRMPANACMIGAGTLT